MDQNTNDPHATRRILEPRYVSPNAALKVASFHSEIVKAVEHAVQSHAVVVVGMAQNPHVKRVRKLFDDAGIAFTYLEYGSYLSKWKERLAIKLWSGWPTFPQVYVRGVLIGGFDLTQQALANGTLTSRLSAANVPDAARA